MKRWAANIISSVIPNKTVRKKFRVKLQFNTKWCIDFVREYTTNPNVKLSTYIGRGGMNYIVVADKKYVFKFPIQPGANKNPIAEKRISDYFARIAPCHVPKLEIIEHNGIYIRKYDFIDGVIIEAATPDLVNKNITKIATQIAEFMFCLASADPDELSDLKPKNSDTQHFMYGWMHNDIGGNFILDPRTMDVIGFIDWENACFGDIMPDMVRANFHWSKFGYNRLGIEIMKIMAEKYIEQIKNKK